MSTTTSAENLNTEIIRHPDGGVTVKQHSSDGIYSHSRDFERNEAVDIPTEHIAMTQQKMDDLRSVTPEINKALDK